MIMEELEFTGHWWLPNNPDKTICGNLVYIPNKGANLTLIGSFRDDNDYFKLMAQELSFKCYEIILGLDEEGNEITLLNCTEKPHGFRFNKGRVIINQPFSIEYIFKGHHFRRIEDITFNTVFINYSYLDEWVNKQISPKLLINKEDKTNYKFPLDIKKPESITLVKNDYYEIFVDYDFSHPLSALKEFIIKQKAYLVYKYLKNERPWYDFVEIINSMQDFFTIATIETVYPLNIHGRTENYISITSDGKKTIQPEIDIIICYSKIPTSFEDIKSYDMLFSYNDVSDKIKIIIPSWLEKYQDSKFIYDNYFGPIYQDIKILGDHFLNLVIALESYHRKNMRNYNMDPEKLNERIIEIKKAIPKYEDWLEYKLRYNEPNLEKRLQDIMKGYLDIFGGKNTVNGFIREVVDIRNKSIIHKNEESESNTEKLAYITAILMIIFKLCLLKDMGFNKEEIHKLLFKEKKKKPLLFESMGMN